VVPNSGALSLNALQRAAVIIAQKIYLSLFHSGIQSDGPECISSTAESTATNSTKQTRYKQYVPSLNYVFLCISEHFHVFVGDLSQDVDNQMLKEAFEKYGEVS
jgi:hypothetical protein